MQSIQKTAGADSFALYAHSIRGKRHLQDGKPCQDAYASCITPLGWQVLAAADGVSESPLSEVSSRKAVDAICDYWKNFITKFQGPEDVLTALKASFNYAAAQSKSEEKDHPVPFGYETTLQVCLLIPERFMVVMWCGDGGIYAQFEDGTVRSLAEAQRSAEGEVISLCAGPDHWKWKMADAQSIQTVLMVTDGVNDALLGAENTNDGIRDLMHLGQPNIDFSNQLEALMRKPPFETIHDDITVVLLKSQSSPSAKQGTPSEDGKKNQTEKPSDSLSPSGKIPSEHISSSKASHPSKINPGSTLSSGRSESGSIHSPDMPSPGKSSSKESLRSGGNPAAFSQKAASKVRKGRRLIILIIAFILVASLAFGMIQLIPQIQKLFPGTAPEQNAVLLNVAEELPKDDSKDQPESEETEPAPSEQPSELPVIKETEVPPTESPSELPESEETEGSPTESPSELPESEETEPASTGTSPEQ